MIWTVSINVKDSFLNSNYLSHFFFFFFLVNSPDFKKGVSTLAHMLKISAHPDHLVTLKACSKFISKRLSAEAISNPDSLIIKVQNIITFTDIIT